ncbi:MAG: MtrB/PioB family decaheme-associated outer membrane protein [Rhodospirillales bacterium]|nr:MAG: MtrB/PioB family decaheme-associated outer membrane protein [Rhodospirillales bacterium]
MTTHKVRLLMATTIILSWPALSAAQEDRSPLIVNGTAEFGAGYVDGGSFKFGEYTGLAEDGAFFIGSFGATARDAYDDDAAFYLEMEARSLGLENRSLQFEAGSQGRYGLGLDYQSIPHYLQGGALTPYSGEGTNVLTLPPSWPTLPANGDTSTMPLASTLRAIDLKTQRERFGGNLFFLPRENWRFDVNYRNETKTGTQTTFGMFGENGGNPGSVALAEPVDYETNEVDVIANYASSDFQLQAIYAGSFFKNQFSSLRWQNAYTGGNPNGGPWDFQPEEGQMALNPDNQAHNLTLSGGYSVSDATRVTGSLAYGVMLQNEDLLPYTINAAIPIGTPLPRSSLDGQINTLRADLGATSRLGQSFDVSGRYRFSDRDNKTPRDVYSYVANDVSNQGDRGDWLNAPHSFNQHLVNLDGAYRLGSYSKFGLGYEYDNMERTYSERDKTEEHTLSARLSGRATDAVDGWVSYSYAARDGDVYVGNAPLRESEVPDPGPGAFENNPDLRKFNIGNRIRNEVRAVANWMASDTVAVSLGANYALDDYDETTIGLTEGSALGAKADMSYSASERLTAYAWYAYDEMGFDQRGYRFTGGELPPFNDPTRFWTIDTTDRVHSLGAGLDWRNLATDVRLTLDYTFSMARTSYDVAGGTGANGSGTTDDLPDVETDIHSLELAAEYDMTPGVTFRLAYLFEYFDSVDFALDNVAPDTMDAVLWFGGNSPDYTAHVIGVSTVLNF